MGKIEDIRQMFNMIGLNENNLPKYTNPQEFSKQFIQCSVLNYANSTYSTSSSCNRGESMNHGGNNA